MMKSKQFTNLYRQLKYYCGFNCYTKKNYYNESKRFIKATAKALYRIFDYIYTNNIQINAMYDDYRIYFDFDYTKKTSIEVRIENSGLVRKRIGIYPGKFILVSTEHGDEIIKMVEDMINQRKDKDEFNAYFYLSNLSIESIKKLLEEEPKQ